VAALLTADLRNAGLLPGGYRIVSQRAAAGPMCVLCLTCGEKGEPVYVGFDYDSVWHEIKTRGAEALWQEGRQRSSAR
jgi:hypothetical protein